MFAFVWLDALVRRQGSQRNVQGWIPNANMHWSLEG